MNNARQAIVTRYIPASSSKPSRIKAYCDRGFVIISYPHEFDQQGAHTVAATALIERFAWEDGNTNSWGTIKDWRIGALPQSGRDSYVFVFSGVLWAR